MKQDARNMDDRQERYELFTLVEGEEKVTMEWDLRLPNTAIFTFSREDHTLGNLLTSALLETEHVVFAAYKVPHPLFPTFTLRISTDATISPKEALTTTCKRVIEDLSSLSKKLTREWELTKLAAAKDGRPDLTEEREQWTERERFMREQRAKHAQWDREQRREQLIEIEEEQRRIHDIEREHAKEIEHLRATNQLRARYIRGDASPLQVTHDADPIWERRGGSPERVSGGAARSASPPPARWSASPPSPPPAPARSAVSPSPAPRGQDAPNIASWSAPSSSVALARPTPPVSWGMEPLNTVSWSTSVLSSTAPARLAASPPPAQWGAESPNIAPWGMSAPSAPSSSATTARPATSPSPVPWGTEAPNNAPWITSVPSSTAPARSAASPPPTQWGAESPNIGPWSTAAPSAPSSVPAQSATSPSPVPWGMQSPNTAPWTAAVPSSAAPAQSATSPSSAPWGAESPNIAPWSHPTTTSGAAEDPDHHSAGEQSEYHANPAGSAEGGAARRG